MANSSSEDETDTLPERPTRIQPYQFENLSVRILKEYWNIVSASKQTPLQYSMGFAKSQSLKCSGYTNGRDAAQQESQLV